MQTKADDESTSLPLLLLLLLLSLISLHTFHQLLSALAQRTRRHSALWNIVCDVITNFRHSIAVPLLPNCVAVMLLTAHTAVVLVTNQTNPIARVLPMLPLQQTTLLTRLAFCVAVATVVAAAATICFAECCCYCCCVPIVTRCAATKLKLKHALRYALRAVRLTTCQSVSKELLCGSVWFGLMYYTCEIHISQRRALDFSIFIALCH